MDLLVRSCVLGAVVFVGFVLTWKRSLALNNAHLKKVEQLAEKLATTDPAWAPETLTNFARDRFLQINVDLNEGNRPALEQQMGPDALADISESPFKFEEIDFTANELVVIEHYGDERDSFRIHFRGWCKRQSRPTAVAGSPRSMSELPPGKRDFFDVVWTFGRPPAGLVTPWIVVRLAFNTGLFPESFSKTEPGDVASPAAPRKTA